MTEADLLELNRSRLLRVFTARGGELLGEIRVGPFDTSGMSACSLPTDGPRLDDVDQMWAELVDGAGVVVAVGRLSEHADVPALADAFHQALWGKDQ